MRFSGAVKMLVPCRQQRVGHGVGLFPLISLGLICLFHYAPTRVGYWGHNELMAVIQSFCLSAVCLSRVWRRPDPKSWMGGHRPSDLEIGRKKAYDKVDPWPHLEVERSNTCRGHYCVGRTRPHSSYSWNGNTCTAEKKLKDLCHEINIVSVC